MLKFVYFYGTLRTFLLLHYNPCSRMLNIDKWNIECPTRTLVSFEQIIFTFYSRIHLNISLFPGKCHTYLHFYDSVHFKLMLLNLIMKTHFMPFTLCFAMFCDHFIKFSLPLFFPSILAILAIHSLS